jgi:hypothetical protein
MVEHDDSMRGSRRHTRFDHLFIAIDVSACAGRAIARAGRLHLSQGGRISVVHILPTGYRGSCAWAEKTARSQLEKVTRHSKLT